MVGSGGRKITCVCVCVGGVVVLLLTNLTEDNRDAMSPEGTYFIGKESGELPA